MFVWNQFCFEMSTVKVVTQAKPIVRRLIVGLGNMGNEFHRTRHNVGFAVCRLFASDYLPKMSADDTEWKWKVSKSNKCSLLQTTIHFSQKTELGLDLVDHISDRAMQKTLTQGVPFPHIRLALSLPLTYMNNSGQSVALYTKQNNFRLKNPGSKNHMDEVLVVHDDISVPFGEVRFSPKGGDGGQNGVKSIIKCMATEKIPRLRIGIGAPAGEGQMRADPRYVVGRWDCMQLRLLPYVLHFACEGLRVYLHRGVVAAASSCNYKKCDTAYRDLYPNCNFDHFDVNDVVPKICIVCFKRMRKLTP